MEVRMIDASGGHFPWGLGEGFVRDPPDQAAIPGKRESHSSKHNMVVTIHQRAVGNCLSCQKVALSLVMIATN